MPFQYIKNKIRDFFKSKLWDDSQVNYSPLLKRIIWDPLRVVVLVSKGFYRHECFTRATTLTYVTVLSITPLLAIAFAVLSILASENSSAIEKYLNDLFAPAGSGKSNQFVSNLIAFVKNINIKQVTWFGYFFLILSSLSLISSLENSFNKIWGIQRGRSLLRKIGSYSLILFMLPFFVTVTISLSTNYQSFAINQTSDIENTLDRFKGHFYFLDLMVNVSSYALHYFGKAFSHLLQFLFGWFLFTALYFYLPFTKVRITESIKGGLIAAILFELAKPVFTSYVKYFLNSSNIGKIYGALSFLPVALLWLYVVWLIVLLGAEFTYAFQNVNAYLNEVRLANMNRKSRDIIILKMIKDMLLHQQIGQFFTIEELSDRFHVPFYFTDESLSLLSKAGIIYENPDTGRVKILNEELTPSQVVLALWQTGNEEPLDIRARHPELDRKFVNWESALISDKNRFEI